MYSLSPPCSLLSTTLPLLLMCSTVVIYMAVPLQGSDMSVICWSDYWRSVIMFVFSSHRISVVMKMLFFSKFWLNLYTIIEWTYFNLNSSFLVLQMGVITKWCNTKNWKTMEQYRWKSQNKSEPTTVSATPRKTHSNSSANHHKIYLS